MAIPESNRKAVMRALENLQYKIDELENKNTNKIIQFDCQTSLNYEMDILNKLKETEDQFSILKEQIENINKKLKIIEGEKMIKKYEIITSEIGKQPNDCRDNNHQKLHDQQPNDCHDNNHQKFLDKFRTVHSQPSFEKTYTENNCQSKALKCGAVSMERCTSPIFSLQDLHHNSSQSTLPTGKPLAASNFNSLDQPNMNERQQYKFDFSNIPFTVGKSVSPSYSLMANFQEVLSLMKQHQKLSKPTLLSRSHSTSNCLTKGSKSLPTSLNSSCAKCNRAARHGGEIKGRSMASLCLLRNMRKLQTVLKTDDIVWVP